MADSGRRRRACRGRRCDRGRRRGRTRAFQAGVPTVATSGAGRVVRIVRIAGGRRLLQRLAALGIVPGVTVRVERAAVPPLICIGDTRIAIGREVAGAIEVEDVTA